MHAGMGKLNDRELYLATTIGVLELLKTGTTSIIEHAHVTGSLIGVEGRVEAIVKSIMDTGIRAVIAPSYADIKYSECIPLNLLEKPSPELLAILDPFPPPAADDILQVLRHIIEQWQNRDSRIDLFLGPSNTKSCSRYLMESTVELASKFGLGIHCHLLETKSERMFFPSVVDYLESVHCLGSNVSFAHGVWLDNKDIKTLAQTNTSIIHNPISNLKLGSGIAPIQTMKDLSLNVALGADNAGSANDSQNMFEVMKYAALIHKLYGTPTKWLGAEDAFTMCVTNGAKVLRKNIGAIKPGYLADIVIIGGEKLFVNSKENLINQLVYTNLGFSSVETVLVGGNIVVEEGKVKMVNEDELFAEAKECAQKIYSDIPALNNRLAPALDFLSKMGKVVSRQKLHFTRFADI